MKDKELIIPASTSSLEVPTNVIRHEKVIKYMNIWKKETQLLFADDDKICRKTEGKKYY